AVAVGVVSGKPVVVSAGEDGWVYVWDRDLKVLGAWRQPNGVRSLAVTRPEAGSALALVGGVNGTATVYDLADPKAKGREFDGRDGAKVEHRIDSRSGDVTMPGVTDDGSRLLLDADKSHLDVIHLQELRKERPLVTAGEAVRFTTFTAWSPELDKKPDNRLIATTGGTEGVVQLWWGPTGEGRGAEVARFVTHNYAAATCAAFSPQAESGFLVVGTRKGEVHLWPLPTESEIKTLVPTTVTHVEQNIESSGRTVNVLVDFDNPKVGDKYLLRPGSAVTLVIRPKK